MKLGTPCLRRTNSSLPITWAAGCIAYGAPFEAAARLERRPSLPRDYEVLRPLRAKWVGASETVLPGTMARRFEACRRFEGAFADLGRQRRAAGPADFEGGGILLAALRAVHRRPRLRAQVFVDESAGALGVRGILDPDLGKGCLDRKLAGEARGGRVEDARANAPVGGMGGE